MGIVNRSLDVSEQKDVFHGLVNLTVGASAGSEFPIAIIPYPGVIKALGIACESLSGAPAARVQIKRWSSAGQTTILGLAATLTLGQFSTVGFQGFSLQAPGSSLVQVQTGDVVQINTIFAGGNVAAANTSFALVVQALQDVKSHFNATN